MSGGKRSPEWGPRMTARSRGRAQDVTDDTLISPTDHHCFLGLLVDQSLTYKQHVVGVYAKGTRLVRLLRRLTTMHNSLTLPVVRQLYLSVVIPSVLYTTDVLSPNQLFNRHIRGPKAAPYFWTVRKATDIQAPVVPFVRDNISRKAGR